MATLESPSEVETSSPAPSQADQSPKLTLDTKGLEESPVTTLLLAEHKEQSLVVEGIKQEIEALEQYPILFLEERKKFLYFAYTQTLNQCAVPLNFDVKVYFF
jgi:hypothetical protein